MHVFLLAAFYIRSLQWKFVPITVREIHKIAIVYSIESMGKLKK